MRGMGKHKKRTGGYTPHRDGWVKWYRGKTRFVAGKSARPDQLDDLWAELKKAIDSGEDAPRRRHTGGMILRELLAAFFTHLDHRAATRKPRPIAARTVHTLKQLGNAFGNVVGGSTPIADIGPECFAAYAATIAHYKASGYASNVACVRSIFNWAVKMEYLDRARFGASFVVPAKQVVRDERIAKPKSFDAADVARLIDRAGQPMRAFVTLGVVAAMTPSEIANLTRECVDLVAGVIDFRRRKTGKIRRVIPLPAGAVAILREYVRPDVDGGSPLFFLRPSGEPYIRKSGAPISDAFYHFARRPDVRITADGGGTGFSGLRTTFVNLAPPGTREEIELITGHAIGTVLLDSYLERVGIGGLKRVTSHVWKAINTARRDGKRASV